MYILLADADRPADPVRVNFAVGDQPADGAGGDAEAISSLLDRQQVVVQGTVNFICHRNAPLRAGLGAPDRSVLVT